MFRSQASALPAFVLRITAPIILNQSGLLFNVSVRIGCPFFSSIMLLPQFENWHEKFKAIMADSENATASVSL